MFLLRVSDTEVERNFTIGHAYSWQVCSDTARFFSCVYREHQGYFERCNFKNTLNWLFSFYGGTSLQLLLAVCVLIHCVFDASFWCKQIILPRSTILAIRAVLAPLRMLGSWKSEKGMALCEVENRLTPSAVYTGRRKPPFPSFCLWSGVPIPCPAQKWG